jgi:hypothetical protein
MSIDRVRLTITLLRIVFDSVVWYAIGTRLSLIGGVVMAVYCALIRVPLLPMLSAVLAWPSITLMMLCRLVGFRLHGGYEELLEGEHFT